MNIAGVQKFTLLDFPSKVACIVFTPGCNFRCPYCYNSDFVIPEKIEEIKDIFIPENIFFNFLKTRNGFLDGVVISGGEPTLQVDLIDFINKIKELGYKVKIDTNGTNPKIILELIEEKIIDYVAMDVKAPIEKYQSITNVLVNIDNILESINIIKDSNIEYEFRTTIIKEQLSQEDLEHIAKMIEGSKKYYLQKFRNNSVILDPSFKDMNSYSDKELEDICRVIKEKYNISICEFR